MEKNLLVPYLSQWDSTASKTRNDCGPASAAMALNYYGETLTVDDVFARTGAGQGFITLSQLKTAVESYGYTCEAYANGTSDKIKEFINQGIPVITVVHYGNLTSRQDTNFIGPHIFLTVGYRDDGYFVNDPDFWGSFRKDGDHHFYTKGEFEAAWEQSQQDGNIRNTFMVIHPKKVQVADTDMVISKDLFMELRTKAEGLDKVSDALGYAPANGYPFDGRKDPAFSDMLVEKIRVLLTPQPVTYATTATITAPVSVTTSSNTPLPLEAEKQKNILFQDVSDVFKRLLSFLGGNK